jgi:hypothetical protein
MIVSAALATAAVANDQATYVTALDRAHARSYHSYFNQHVLNDAEVGYITIDEGDYGALSAQLAERVIETVPSKLCDEI